MIPNLNGIKAKVNEIYAAVEDKVRDEIDADRNEQAPVRRVILAYSGAAAAVAANPLPFAEFAMLTPVHVAMVLHIGHRLGHPITVDRAGEVFKRIVAAVGLSAAVRFTAGALLKVGLPFVGGLLRAPVAFAFTYGLGRVAEDYFISVNQGFNFDAKTARAVFEQAVREGRVAGAYADLLETKPAAKKSEPKTAAKKPARPRATKGGKKSQGPSRV
jgi:uncharacterized protein (DUF697 family)